MDGNQKKYAEIILERQKKKRQVFLIMYAILFPIGVICEIIMAIYSDNDIISNILFCILLADMIALILVMMPNTIDWVKNGSDKFVAKQLNDEGRKFLIEKGYKKAWYDVINPLKYKRKEKFKMSNFSKFAENFFSILLLFILFLFVSALTNCTSDVNNKETKKQTSANEDLTWFAQYACEKEIKARAIYPPSTKVHFRRDNYIKGNSYTLYGTVDSQNAFGAMVRQNFACEAIIDKPNDKYWINDLNIE